MKAHEHEQLIDDGLRGIPICCYKGCSVNPTWIVYRNRQALYICDNHYGSLTGLYQREGITYWLRPYSGSNEETARTYRESRPLPLNIMTGFAVIAAGIVVIPIVAAFFAINSLLPGRKIPSNGS